MAEPQTVDDVIARLEAIDQELPVADGVACFNRMYLTVTRGVRDRIGTGFFADPATMQVLDVTFANLYLAAVDADTSGSRVPHAWAPLFDRRADGHVAALQFAIAGMNAHINHDLPVAVVATCARLGSAPEGGTFHSDYLKVNEVLAEVEQQVRESYLSDTVLGAEELGRVLDLLGNWSIEKARDAAWVNADVLWRLHHVGFARDAFRRALSGSVGMTTAMLLAPVLL